MSSPRSTTINLLAEVPRLGTSISVREPLNEVTRKVITADRFNHSTIEFTKHDGDSIVIPARLIGPIEGVKLVKSEDDE